MDGRHPQSCVLTGLPPPTLRTQPGPSSWARPSPGAGQPGTPTLDSQRPEWGERNFHCLPATWFLEVYYKWTKTKPTLGNQPLPAPAAHAHLLVSPSSSRTPEVTWTPPAGLLAALLAPWHLVLMRWSCCGPMSPSQGIWQNTKHRQRHTPTPTPSPTLAPTAAPQGDHGLTSHGPSARIPAFPNDISQDQRHHQPSK